MRTVGEFKAFIDGMDIEEGKAPTPKQWKRLMDRLEQMEASQILDLLGSSTKVYPSYPTTSLEYTPPPYSTCSTARRPDEEFAA